MKHLIILAGSRQEATSYAKSQGLRLGQYIYAQNAASIHGLRRHDIVELPGFATRPDRHAINATTRFFTGERTVVVPEVATDEQVDAFELDQLHSEALEDDRRRTEALEHIAEMERQGFIEPEGFEPPSFENATEFLEWVGDNPMPERDVELVLADERGPEGYEPGEVVDVIVPDQSERKRRSRCKTCGVLVWSDEDPAHLSDAHESAKPKPPTSPEDFFTGSDIF